MHHLYVIGGEGLRFSATDPDVTPYVEIYASSTVVRLVGTTRHISSGNPVWNAEFRCPFFQCISFKFIVLHHRLIGPDVVLGAAGVSVNSMHFGEPMVVPIIMTFACPNTPLLTVRLDRPDWSPFPGLSPRASYTRLYAYLSYSPPLPDAYDTLPVSIRGIAVDVVECRSSAFDHTTSWEPFGETTFGKTAIGETGATQVISFPVSNRFVSTFLICTHDYSGTITMHFVATTKARSDLLQSVAVVMRRNSVQSIPGRIAAGRHHTLRFEATPSFLYVDGGFFPAFEFEIARQMHPNVSRQRFIQPVNQPWSLAKLAFWHQTPLLHSIHAVFGWIPVVEKDDDGSTVYHISLSLMFFGARGQPVDGMFRQGKASWRSPTEFAMFWSLSCNSELFSDQCNVRLELDTLQIDVGSVAFIASAPLNYTVSDFGRKFVRIIDAATFIELMMFPYEGREGSGPNCLIGGLVYREDAWEFHPVLKQFGRGPPEGAAPIWLGMLEERGLFAAR
jgi:hypothetical protein